MKNVKQIKNIALTVTALITATSAFAGRPMRGVPSRPAKTKSKLSAVASAPRLRSLSPPRLDVIDVLPTRSCRFVPLNVNEQIWIPTMYIEPSTAFKGIYQPLISEGMIANDPVASADAKRVWPNSSKQWMAIPEIEYGQSMYDLNNPQESNDYNAILGLHTRVISATESDYQSRKTARNVTAQSVLTPTETALLKTAMNRFIIASGAADYNKSLCDRLVKTGETNEGVISTPKSNVKNIPSTAIDSTYATVSSSIYLISDVYYVQGQDGIVSYDRNRSFVIGYSREPGMTTEVYGCNLCQDIGIGTNTGLGTE